MTEYTSNSDAIREWMTSRQRTAHWVNTYTGAPHGTEFVSPSHPPSMLDDSDVLYGPSDSDDDAYSTHSLPPRMMLRYNDGRPDIPISYGVDRPRQPSGPQAAHKRAWSGSQVPVSHTPQPHYAQSLSYASDVHDSPLPIPIPPPNEYPAPPRSPESIMILPSRDSEEQSDQQSPSHAPSVRSRHADVSRPSYAPSQASHSHSRSAASHRYGPGIPVSRDGSVGRVPSHPSMGSHRPSMVPRMHSQPQVAAPIPRRAFDEADAQSRPRSPSMAYSHSHPPQAGSARFHDSHYSSGAQSQLPYTYAPPSIVYAPSSKHSSHYKPPAIVYSPGSSHHSNTQSRRGPQSISFSHSVPLPQGSMHSQHSIPRSMSAQPQGAYGYHAEQVIYEEDPEPVPTEEVRSHRARSQSMGRSSSRGRAAVRDMAAALNARSRSASTPSLSEDEGGSRTSGSTYYVLPTPGQKVKLISPTGGSVYTTSTKSPHIPYAPDDYAPRKPFFQRIFSIPKLARSVDSNGSSQGKKLNRSHAYGGAHQQGGRPPVGAVRR